MKEFLFTGKNIISLFRDVYIKVIPEPLNYYLFFPELIEKNEKIISTVRLQIKTNGEIQDEVFPKFQLQFQLKKKIIKKGFISKAPQFKYFYKRKRGSKNEGEDLVEIFPTEEFNWKYPVTDPITGKEINSFHVIQRLY